MRDSADARGVLGEQPDVLVTGENPAYGDQGEDRYGGDHEDTERRGPALPGEEDEESGGAAGGDVRERAGGVHRLDGSHPWLGSPGAAMLLEPRSGAGARRYHSPLAARRT